MNLRRDEALSSLPRLIHAGLNGLAALAVMVLALGLGASADGAELRAGVAKVDITDRESKPVNDPLYVKALVLKDERATAALITVDVVAIARIGRIGDGFLGNVRLRLERELGIPPRNVVVNASHCHGAVCADVESRTVQAVKEALGQMTPVRAGAGRGYEDRIMENRRLQLKDGSEADVRHAYALPPDETVAAVGPIDPDIGLLRLDRTDGRPLAVVYNFACHPIQGVPSGGNTADYPGFASRVLEENLGHGAMALFVQGCGGDINPVRYKDVHNPRDAETLGNMLGLSALRAARNIETKENAELRLVHEVVELPRANDHEKRIAALQAEQTRLLRSLRGTSLNFKNFVFLLWKYKASGEFPSHDAHRYLHEQALGREDLKRLDAENRANLEAYLRNIHVMEQLTRLNTNLDLLKMHQAENAAAGKPTIEAEVVGLRVGDFVLVTFPGELSVEIGLGIKKRAPAPFTFVAGCTNGYLYYAPTEKQRNNPGFAQEDCDCLLAPNWQGLFDEKVDAILQRLQAAR